MWTWKIVENINPKYHLWKKLLRYLNYHLYILLNLSIYRHMHLYKELEYWSRSRNSKAPPKGPLLSWFLMLILPAAAFAIIVSLGSLFGWYSGLVACVLSVLLVGYVSTRHHRLTHMCKWVFLLKVGNLWILKKLMKFGQLNERHDLKD